MCCRGHSQFCNREPEEKASDFNDGFAGVFSLQHPLEGSWHVLKTNSHMLFTLQLSLQKKKGKKKKDQAAKCK